jgi:hypothetical protein
MKYRSLMIAGKIFPALLLIMMVCACRSISSPRFSQPSNREEAWAQDLEYLQGSFPKYNSSFSPESLAVFDSILEQTLAAIPSLSDNEIYVNILKAVAAPGDGHTSVNLWPSAQKLRRLPLRFYWFSDGLYVVKTTKGYSELLGARIMEIAGYSPEELVKMMRDVVAGNESAVRYESNYYLSSPDFLQGLGVISEPDTVQVTFQRPDGSTGHISLSPEPMGPQVYGYGSWRELSPLSTESQDTTGMVHILDGDTLPPYIATPNQSCSQEYFAEHQTLYVQVSENTNMNSNMSDFAKEVEGMFASHQVDTVIVDLRFNSGGNLLLTTNIVKGIPKWHTGSGNIYVIIGGPTFSAGIVTAARLKYYAGDRAVVVGEPAAEGLKFWAETRFFTLPNSQILIFAAYRYHNWENTNYERDKQHFWLMKQVGVPAEDLDVDLPAGVLFADYLAGQDTVVEMILKQRNQ